MSSGRVAFGWYARIGGAALWLLACSSGVDQYRFVGNKAKHGASGDSGVSTGGDGGATGNGGGGGRGNGGSGNRAGGGDGGSAGNTVLPTGGTGAEEAGGGGGAETGGGGGDEAGGAASGGKGGAGNGGSGGKATGGSGNGGSGNGGMGNGGSGAGGMTTLGDPTLMRITNLPTTGITAAAWDGQSVFQLLQPSASQFWTVDPMAGTAAAHALPNTATIAPNFIGASPTWILVIAGSRVYRIPRMGFTSEGGVAISAPTFASGAVSGDILLIGDASGSGKTAQALQISTNTLIPSASSLTAIAGVASDSENFAFATYGDGGFFDFFIHRVTAGTFQKNSTPCKAGTTGTATNQISVHGSTVAWILGAQAQMTLSFATISPTGVCDATGSPIVYGSSNAAPTAVGLVDDSDAMVVDDFSSASGHVSIHARNGGTGKQLLVNFGGAQQPKSIIVGTRSAVIVTGNVPTVLRF